jgi:hypothetical protein
MTGFKLIALGLLSAFISIGAQAQTMATTDAGKRVMISPTPQGNCKTVEGHWQGTTWIATHEVCKYENRKEGVAWVNSYWSCIDAGTDGTCTNWTLVPGAWVQTAE